MGVILEHEGEGAAGYTKPVPLILHQSDLHNLIVLTVGAAKRLKDSEPSKDYSQTLEVYMAMAHRLEAAWKRSLAGTPEGNYRRRR